MTDSEMVRYRSGQQWSPARTGPTTISVIDSAPRAVQSAARSLPFGFGIRDETVGPPVSEWEGNPS